MAKKVNKVKKTTKNLKVVGMNFADYDVSTLKVGDELTLRLDTYEKDPTAIEVKDSSDKRVGYIANRTGTAGAYPMAKDVFSEVVDYQTVKVVENGDDLVIALETEAVEDTIKTKELKVTGLLTGNKIEYPNRMLAMMAMKKGKCKLDYTITNDKVVVVYDGVAAGYISTDVSASAQKTLDLKGIKLSTNDEIIKTASSAKEVIVNGEFVDATVIPITLTCKVEVSSSEVTLEEGEIVDWISKFKKADKKEIEKRIDWLKSIGTNEYAIKLFMNRIESHTGIAPFQPCYIVNGKEIENAIAFSHGIDEHRGNLLLAGPAGSGKNMFIITFANLMDLQLIDKSCSAGVDEEAVFGFLSMKASEEKPDAEAVNLAFKRMLKSSEFSKLDNKQMLTELGTEEQIKILEGLTNDDDFDYSVLFDAMRSQTAEIQFEPSVITKGLEIPSLINFDEVNTLRPTVTSALHSALDKRRSVLVNGYKTVDIDSEVIFTATMNEGGEYAGTSTLNLAFEDRWHVLEFEAPESIAKILKQEVPGLNSRSINSLDRLYKKMKSIRGHELDERSFSQRAFIYCGINIALGNDIKSAIFATIVAKIRDAEDRESVKAIVDLMIK